MSARKYTIEGILRLIARRRWLILVPFAVGVAMAPILARYAPMRYRSDALIVVRPQQVPDSFVKPTVSESVAERLPAITDTILSRNRLQQIIEAPDLYKAKRLTQVMEDVVQGMRDDVTTTAVAKEKVVDSFRISYISDNAELAQKVTERLASLYINQNLTDWKAQADATSVFLEAQLAESKGRLIDQEKKLEEYRKSHAGEMPSQLTANLQAIQNANLQLQSVNESTNRAQERRLLIERQLADVLAVPATPASFSGIGADPPVSASATQQLELAQARRAALLQRFTADHPDVVSLDRTIAELLVRIEHETPVSATTATREVPLTPAESAQQKKINDFQAELAVIDYQLAANRAEDVRLKRTIADYQAKVDIVPTRESELVELTRDYGTMQTAYASLLMKHQDSVMAANLEGGQIGEQFKIIDQASLPGKPTNQSQRVGIMASGAIGGLIFGLVLVGLLEYRDSSFRGAAEVLAELSLPVLASIPVMNSEQERLAGIRRRLAIDVGGSALLVAAGLVLVVWRLRS